MRPPFDRTSTPIVNAAAPEDDPLVGIFDLKLQPDVESVDCPRGKEVSDLTSAHNNIEADRRSRLNYGRNLIDWGCDLTDLSNERLRPLIGFLTGCEAGQRLWRITRAPHQRRFAGHRSGRRHSKNVHSD